MKLENDVNNKNQFDRYAPTLFVLISVTALLIARGAFFGYQSGDYIYFLKPWIEEYQTMTFLEGLGTKVGTYNPPYMYLLNIISRFNVSDLIVIKIISVFFDFLMAYFVMKIVALRTNRINVHIFAFLLTLSLPTVVLNSAMWGQCDSIYAAFAIGSVYFGLTGQSRKCYAFMALALAFKLQAVFLLPMLPMFVIANKIKLKDCYMFFAVYLAALLPAIVAGMPLYDALFSYVSQANYYSWLNLNMINIWRFVENVEYNSFRTAGIYMTGVAVLALMYFTYINRARLINTVDFVRLAYLFAVIIPFMLPKMHDRYYFMADILAVGIFFYDKRRWYVPAVTVICSFISYAYFLMFRVELIEYRYAVIVLFIVIILVLRDYIISLRTDISSSEPEIDLTPK